MVPDVALPFVRSLDATPSVQNVLLAFTAAVLTWSLGFAFYNVYLHPLARFPGPKLAAASKYWLFYQEFVRGISLSDIRDELHAQYGARSVRFSNGAADTNVALSIAGDIIRLQPNLVRWWKSDISLRCIVDLGWIAALCESPGIQRDLQFKEQMGQGPCCLWRI